jgi:hypothetical protein
MLESHILNLHDSIHNPQTTIDPATGWFEIVKATNKSTTSIQDLYHNTWLARNL